MTGRIDSPWGVLPCAQVLFVKTANVKIQPALHFSVTARLDMTLRRVSEPAARRAGYMLRRRAVRDTERVAPVRLNPAFTEEESIKQSDRENQRVIALKAAVWNFKNSARSTIRKDFFFKFSFDSLRFC